tara:strand:+ start:436 stop:936 length:501 start_codon:yes stop_codon:yes gene_type:complete
MSNTLGTIGATAYLTFLFAIAALIFIIVLIVQTCGFIGNLGFNTYYSLTNCEKIELRIPNHNIENIPENHQMPIGKGLSFLTEVEKQLKPIKGVKCVSEPAINCYSFFVDNNTIYIFIDPQSFDAKGNLPKTALQRKINRIFENKYPDKHLALEADNITPLAANKN